MRLSGNAANFHVVYIYIYINIYICIYIYTIYNSFKTQPRRHETLRDISENTPWRLVNKGTGSCIPVISQCNYSFPNSAPFSSEMCTFLFCMVHCGIWNGCILEFVRLIYRVIIIVVDSRYIAVLHNTLVRWTKMTARYREWMYSCGDGKFWFVSLTLTLYCFNNTGSWWSFCSIDKQQHDKSNLANKNGNKSLVKLEILLDSIACLLRCLVRGMYVRQLIIMFVH